MHTLIMEPILTKEVQNEDYSIPEVFSSLQLVFKSPIEVSPNFNEAIDLFKNNADFIEYGLSSMT